MRQKVIPGGEIEALTPAEAAELLEFLYRENVEYRVRADATIQLDGTGGGQDEVYAPPLGFEFEARRVAIELSTATDPGTGQVALAAGKTVEYLRSGTRIEWGQPGFGATVQVPGVQSWGTEQGPYIRNGESFEVRARGLTVNAGLKVTVEGVLKRPPPDQHEHRPPAEARRKGSGRTHPARPGPS